MTKLTELIEEANKKSLHYIGERYYYSTATETLYLRVKDKLSPVLEKGLNMAVMYQQNSKSQKF